MTVYEATAGQPLNRTFPPVTNDLAVERREILPHNQSAFAHAYDRIKEKEAQGGGLPSGRLLSFKSTSFWPVVTQRFIFNRASLRSRSKAPARCLNLYRARMKNPGLFPCQPFTVGRRSSKTREAVPG